MEQIITGFAVAVTAIILLSASVYDWRYREIPDWHWMALFLLSIVLSVIVVVRGSTGAVGFLMPICIAVIAFDCLFDRDSSRLFDIVIYLIVAVTAAIPFHFIGGDVGKAFISIPIMYAVMTILYYTGIVKGGADAKSIIAIAAVFPIYPEMFGLPLIPVPDGAMPQVFVPAFAVLTMALVISLFYGMYNIVCNLIRGDTAWPQMFLGTRMTLEKAKGSKVWPMAEICDGEVVDIGTANEDEGIWNELGKYDVQEIWVTAMIPFLIPIAIAYLIMVVVGFPLFIL